MAKYLDINNGQVTQVNPITQSTGPSDGNKIPQTDNTGRLDLSVMPLGLAIETTTIQASEAINAGSFINIFDSGGGAVRVRNADNSNNRKADGYIIGGVANGANATIYYGNILTGLTGLTVGAIYYLGTAGAITTTAPTTAGAIVQRIGKAISTTQLLVEIQDTILLA